MFSSTIGIEYKYDFKEPKFRVAFEFLKRRDVSDLPIGWIDLDHGVRVSIQHYVTSPEQDLYFETHEKFFDIQYMIEGVEFIGVCSKHGLLIKDAYSIENDVTFYKDPAACGKILLNAGDFVVVAPEDAHKPRCCVFNPIAVKKIVCKVPV